MKKLFFIFFLFNGCLWAQDPYHYNINIENGLPTNEVYEILLSKKSGMLYIATNKGLARYNGSVVEEIDIPTNEKLSITSLDEDQYGNIYFVSFKGGVWCYNGSEVYLIKQLMNTKFGYPNLEVFADSLLIFSKNNKSFYTYDPKRNLMDSIVIEKNSTSTVMVNFYGRSKDGILLKYNDKTMLYKNGAFQLIQSKQIEPIDLIELAGTNYIVGKKPEGNTSNETAYFLDYTQPTKVRTLQLSNLFGNRLLRSLVFMDKLYILTNKGILLYNNQFELQEHWFKNLNISFMQQDASGTIWLATLDHGIIVIPNKFVKVRNELFGDEVVTNLLLSNNSLSYLTNGRYKEWPSKKILNRNFDLSALMYQTTQFPNAITVVNTEQNLVYNTDPPNNTVELSLKNGLKWASYFKDENIFFTSASGSFAMYGSEEALTKFNKLYLSENLLKSESKQFGFQHSLTFAYCKNYTHYYNTASGYIYLGTRDGLFLLTPNRKKYELKWKGEQIQSDFLYPTKAGNVVWSGGSTGLYKLKDKKAIKHWTAKEGLLYTRIDRLRQQGDTLLLIYEKGVQLFTEKAGVFATYTSANYLPKSSCLDAAIYNNELFVSTQVGVYSIPLRAITPDVLHVRIAGLWSKNKKLLPGKTIDYKNNSIYFKIEGTALNSRGNFVYAYRLMPTGKEWDQQSATNNEIRFNSLQEGSYTLQVKLLTGFGESEVVSYRFKIKPPWYRSWWFYVLCGLLLLAIIIIIFYTRIRQIKKQAAYDKKIKQSEITAIKAQMNPHFVFNALNSVQNFVIKKDFENTNEYLGMFSDLVRKTLKNSGKNEISLTEELEMLHLYLDLEKLRFRDTIDIQFHVHIPAEDIAEIGVPPMVIQPFVENVFKHGLLHKEGNKELTISIEKKQDVLQVEIIDNGVGRKRAAAFKNRNSSTGFSTTANQKRMKLLSEIYNQKIKVTITDAFPEKEDCGTRVLLLLPIMHHH